MKREREKEGAWVIKFDNLMRWWVLMWCTVRKSNIKKVFRFNFNIFINKNKNTNNYEVRHAVIISKGKNFRKIKYTRTYTEYFF